jgi:MFS family permease
VVGLAGVFTLARFSEGYLLLRAAQTGLSPALVPGVLVLMNLMYLLSAYAPGHLADRYDRRLLLAAGVGVLVLADLILAWADSVRLVLAGAMVWRLHMGATQGLLAALVGDAAPARLRGTAFGIFNLVNGLALLGASIIAGLWSSIGPNATFLAGAAFAFLSGCGLLGAGRLPRKRTPL